MQAMRRRAFMRSVAASAVWPLAACAPQPLTETASSEQIDALLEQAKSLGAPMVAVRRALEISRRPVFPKQDVFAVFDISQPSAERRFYLLDLEAGQVTAHYAAHGRDNGPQVRAVKFKGFRKDLDMVPLGPLKTEPAEVMPYYKTIIDHYDGTVYRNMIVAVLKGAAAYNRYIDDTGPERWIIHPNWYTTAAFRARNGGVLGRSNGCITLDPVESNAIIARLQGGALIYVAVGNAPIERFL